MSSGSATEALPSRLQDLPRWLEGTQGYSALVAALERGDAATIDGAWNSSSALIAAALGLKAPRTLLVVLAHPRDLDGLRHAFQLDDYPVTGQLSGDFHLSGQYQHPIGFGGMTAFWQRHYLGRDIDVIGLETATSIPPMPLVKTPALQLTAGIARVRIERKTRGWVGVRWKP